MKAEIISWQWRWGTATLVGFCGACFKVAAWLREGAVVNVALVFGVVWWIEALTVVWLALTILDLILWWRCYQPFRRHVGACDCHRCVYGRGPRCRSQGP